MFAVLLLAGLFVITVVTTIFLFGVYTSRINGAFRSLATRYRGELRPGGWLSRPRVAFEFHGRTAAITTCRAGVQDAAEEIEFSIRFPNIPLWCEVSPTGSFRRLGTLLGIADVPIGDPQFDERYAILGDDRALIRQVLCAGVRDRIEQLRCVGSNHIFVSIHFGQLVIRKRGVIRDPARLQEFTQLCLLLYEAAISSLPPSDRGLPDSNGIEFVPSAAQAVGKAKVAEVDATRSYLLTMSQGQAATCQVCGELIVERIVLCRSCNTPHHQDCWEYSGACSTYGCGQTRYQRVVHRWEHPER